MQSRCKPTHRDRAHYFERGIKVAECWLGANGFAQFLADVGRRPSQEHSLDRKNNDKGYEPGNVRWATKEEQSNNRSNNISLTFEGQTLTAAQWARRLGVPKRMLYRKLKKGWPVERILLTSIWTAHDRATSPERR